MKHLLQHKRIQQERAAQAALLIAAASIPNTFQQTQMPRGTVDQGILTGLTMSTNYTLTATIRDAVEGIATQLAGTQDAADDDYAAHRQQRRAALIVDAIGAAGGYALGKKLQQTKDESDAKALARTASQYVMWASIAGLVVGLLQEGADAVEHKVKKDKPRKVSALPLGVLIGPAFIALTELHRRSKEKKASIKIERERDMKSIQAIGMGLGIFGILAATSKGQRKFADLVSGKMDEVLPGSQDFWWRLGHATAVAGTGLGIAALMHKVYRNMESVAAYIEPAYLTPPTSKYVSSGPGSSVCWESLSKEGRRYVSCVTRPDSIKTVMGSRTAMHPIRAFVGLDSAETEDERLEMLMHELDRTRAFERKTIMLISPTGTGYVNYVAVESAEYMSLGNIASVVLQYSKRPSPMSLDRVPEGRKQFLMLIKAVSKKVAELPANKRPRIVIFGESLGAWTSQDVFIGQGTDGLGYNGIDRALWIGTPYGSKWKDEVLGKPRPDVQKELVGHFNDFDTVKKLPAADREKLRYVMITHDNDSVAMFGASLLYRQPDWLNDDFTKRPQTVSKSQFYTSPGTFLLTLMDMKNSMNVIPGKFMASGHDYRADLAEFVREVYGFSTVTDKQMTKIEAALRQNELDRAQAIDSFKEKAKS